MIKVSVEVRSGAARFSVKVRALSIRRAVSLVKERYSKGDVRVKFSIEPESFLVEDASAETVVLEQPDGAAA